MAKVELYVYDLSNGLARSLSLPLTGRQIDGIWHTSVVVWGKEIYYGQGIAEVSPPGTTHHGRPLQIINCGTTEIDRGTFEEYLDNMRDHYTGDKYHLLDFNCNSFTADVVGFLTGGSIPEWITNLPADFLSTPFGASMRPQIDAMFRRGPINAAARPTSTPGGPTASAIPASLLSDVVASATAAQPLASTSTSTPGSSGTNTPTARFVAANEDSSSTSISSPLAISTNLASFAAELAQHPHAIALFLPSGRQADVRTKSLQAVFEGLAAKHGKSKAAQEGKRVGFVIVDEGVTGAESVAQKYDARDIVAPAFVFFQSGDKISEIHNPGTAQLMKAVEAHIKALS